jgi:hypothetical protein
VSAEIVTVSLEISVNVGSSVLVFRQQPLKPEAWSLKHEAFASRDTAIYAVAPKMQMKGAL